MARITGLIELTDIYPSPDDRDLYYKKNKETADEIEKETAKISVILSDDHLI